MGKFLKRNKGPVLAAAWSCWRSWAGSTAVLGVQSLANARLKKSNGETRQVLIETQK